MIVVHGSWLPAAGDAGPSFAIWGEVAEDTASTSRPRARARKKEGQGAPHPHPFGASAPALLNALANSELAENAAQSDIIVRLPTLGDTPLPSRPFLRENEPEGTPTLAPWRVTGLLFKPGDALALLARLPAPDDTTPSVDIGEDLRFWAAATRFALHLLAGQRFTPALVEQGDHFLACWRPIWDAPEDRTAFDQLAQAMPPASRALARVPNDPTPGPRTLLTDFLNATVDARARQAADFGLRPRKGARSAAHMWLAGLAEEQPEIRPPPAFVEQYRAWAQAAASASAGNFRICFRLDPPATPADDDFFLPAAGARDWALRYFLQAADDLSLLVPAETAWRQRGRALTFLNRVFDQPQERLLAGLGQAARVFAPIERSLAEARPQAALLTAGEAYEFLREAGLLLQASGFGVLLPNLGSGLKARAKLTPKRKAAKGGVARLSFESIIQFDWELALGGQQITRAELERLAALKVPLVQVRGQWVELRPEQLEQALAHWDRRAGDGELSMAEALRLALAPNEVAGVPVSDVEAEDWFSDMLHELSEGARLAPLPQPGDLKGELRHYQVTGFSWLAFLRGYGLGACLADDMGLGKCTSADTLIAINGNLRTAESIWDIYAREVQFDGEGFWATPVEKLLVNSIDENTGHIVETCIRRLYRQHVEERLRKITLEDGSSITITQRHRLLTSKGWTREWHVDDYVCVPATMIWKGEPADSDLVTLLAWQIAEGHEIYQVSRLTITQKDAAILENLLQILKRIGHRYGIKINNPVIRFSEDKQVSSLSLHSKAYKLFLESIGYVWGKLSHGKIIPSFIMQSDLNSVQLFLRSYFDAEASVVESMRSIEISTASPIIIQQLSILLRRFGIWMRISAKQKHATNGTGIFRTYYIGVIGGNSARRFLLEIGFAMQYKQSKLETVCERMTNTNVEGIPASKIVAQAISTTGLPVRHFGMHNTVYINGSQQFSRTSLERVIAGFDRILSGESEHEYRKQKGSKWTTRTIEAYTRIDIQQLSTMRQQLRQLLDQEVFYCRIKSIEDVEYKGWVYDFEVTEHHNFVANNIICHNTIQTISLLLHEKEQNPKIKPALLICPTSVVSNWQHEVARFAPTLRVLIHQGAERRKEDFAAQVAGHDLVISSYALLPRDEQQLVEVEWGAVILDEAQNIKNADTRQAQVARRLQAEHRIALTGTPVENRLSELWSIFQFLNPGYLGGQSDFQAQFARPIERVQDAGAAQRLKTLVGPFILRRLKTDPTVISDLPAKNEIKVFCPLTKEQATLYAAIVRDSLQQIEAADGIQRRGLVLATLMKLKQICNHPAQFLKDNSALPDRSGKLARLTEMLEEVRAVKERALIFTQFAEMGQMLKAHLQGVFGDEVLFLHGGTPTKQREVQIRRFQDDPHGPLAFILSIKAGGTGLNLTRANNVFHFDRWWNPAVENQATDRAFRIGQTRNVQVYKFVCAGTTEERIDEMIERKKALAEQIVGSSEGWITELSTDQLRDLFALRDEIRD